MSLTYFPLPKIAEKQALGAKLFGPTAEFENKKAEPITPSASHEPTTVGRRSKRSDGIVSLFISRRTALTGEPDELISYFSQDPFHSSVNADSSESESKPDDSEPEAAKQA
jgi:hypothetical protein